MIPFQVLLLDGGVRVRRDGSALLAELGVRPDERAGTIGPANRAPARTRTARRDRLLATLARAERTLVIASPTASARLDGLRLTAATRSAMRVVALDPGADGAGDHRDRLAAVVSDERRRAVAAFEARTARRPRIAVVAPPFSGHLHPLLGIAEALRERACDVLVCSTADRRREVEAEGFAFAALVPGLEDEIWALSDIDHRAPFRPRATLREVRSSIGLGARLARDAEVHLRAFGVDAVVADLMLPAIGPVAERVGCVWFTSLPAPLILETPDGPPGYCGGLAPDPTPRGRLRDALWRLAVRAAKDVAFLTVRDLLGPDIPTRRRTGGDDRTYSPTRLLCLGDRTLEFARRWPRTARFTGPVRYTPGAVVRSHGADAALRRAGRPLVVCTFGTHLWHVKRNLPEVARRVADAVPGADVVLALAGGAHHDPEFARMRDGSTAVRIVPYIDYDRLGEADVVVHHGGAGITWAALAAGRRQVVVPVDFDQFDFAERLSRRGLAERVDDLDELPAAVRRALRDPDPASAARARWALRVRSNDGAGRAAEQILADLGVPRGALAGGIGVGTAGVGW